MLRRFRPLDFNKIYLISKFYVSFSGGSFAFGSKWLYYDYQSGSENDALIRSITTVVLKPLMSALL